MRAARRLGAIRSSRVGAFGPLTAAFDGAPRAARDLAAQSTGPRAKSTHCHVLHCQQGERSFDPPRGGPEAGASRELAGSPRLPRLPMPPRARRAQSPPRRAVHPQEADLSCLPCPQEKPCGTARRAPTGPVRTPPPGHSEAGMHRHARSRARSRRRDPPHSCFCLTRTRSCGLYCPALCASSVSVTRRRSGRCARTSATRPTLSPVGGCVRLRVVLGTARVVARRSRDPVPERFARGAWSDLCRDT